MARPLTLADALLEVEVKLSVTRAVREALSGLVVHLLAVRAPPALPADADTLHAEAVVRARRVVAVG